MVTRKTLSIGLVLEGTRDPQLKLPKFLETLKSVAPERVDTITQAMERSETLDSSPAGKETLREFFTALTARALNEYVPPYCYFGEREGGYGVWPDLRGVYLDSYEGGNVLFMDDDIEWPAQIRQEYVAAVGENGSITFYEAQTRKELWTYSDKVQLSTVQR